MKRKIPALIVAVCLSLTMPALVTGCGRGDNPAQNNAVSEQQGSYQDIQSEELKQMIAGKEDIILLDVRENYEYEQGHLPGSILIPIGEITGRYQELDKKKTIVVVCASGARSAQVAQFLAQNGFPRVKNLAGGLMSWPAEELVR